MSFDPSNRGDVQMANAAFQAAREREHYRSWNRSIDDARARARLQMLAQTLLDMLRAQPDVWGTENFDADRAAELCLPIIEGLI